MGIGYRVGMYPIPFAHFSCAICRIMEAMDWGDATDSVRFGAVGAGHVDECEYYILISPQNVIGSTIMTNLQTMVRSTFHANKSLCVY